MVTTYSSVKSLIIRRYNLTGAIRKDAEVLCLPVYQLWFDKKRPQGKVSFYYFIAVWVIAFGALT